MSDTPTVESEEEYQEKREELMQDAAEKKQELDRKQNDALNAIAEGEDFAETEQVELGELEIEVTTTLPGDVVTTVKRAEDLAQSDDVDDILDGMTLMTGALAQITVSDEYNEQFWQAYYDRFGPEGIVVAVERLADPATTKMEERSEGVQSFRQSEG